LLDGLFVAGWLAGLLALPAMIDNGGWHPGGLPAWRSEKEQVSSVIQLPTMSH